MKWIVRAVVVLAVLAGVLWLSWSHIINWMLPADSRPAAITFAVEKLTPEQAESEGLALESRFGRKFDHIARFKEAGILAYEGPRTCLGCHETINYKSLEDSSTVTVDLMKNLTTSAHYRFFTTRHPNVYGFNGKLADNFPMGKINRPCPKPGSFAMTSWAEIVVTESGDTLSEGCGQCHIGGEYQAPLGEMMPGYVTTTDEKNTIDCLICHAVGYDMNKKQVTIDANGRERWTEDRSLYAAMSVGRPTSQNCLRCHQHNFGGDVYIDPADSSFMPSQLNTGTDHPRVLHPGSKRGTPFSPTWDVHAAAGVQCIDCHLTEGHYIAKGTHTTTMMANDLPFVEVACENCHGASPHSSNPELADYLNAHTEKIACQTCHIPSLQPDNATMRDFSKPVFEREEGIYIYDDTVKENLPGKGIVYRWWNGDATFLGNPIGDNPNGGNRYRFYDAKFAWPEYKDFDYAGWYEKVMRPISHKRPSKLYAMKRFQGKQHIDLANMTPFGGMFIPYNLPDYYRYGNADKAASSEMRKSMMKMMYGPMFKYYMLDKFMSFMGADGWNTGSYDDVVAMKHVEPRWIPTDASLEISHAIRRSGRVDLRELPQRERRARFPAAWL